MKVATTLFSVEMANLEVDAAEQNLTLIGIANPNIELGNLKVTLECVEFVKQK